MFSQELQKAQSEERAAVARFNAASDEHAASKQQLQRAEATYSENPSDSNWKAVEVARSREDRASVAFRHAEATASAATSKRESLESAEAAEQLRIDTEKRRQALRATLQERHDRLNGAGFIEPLRKVREGLALVFEGMNEAHEELAHLQNERASLQYEAAELGVMVPSWHFLPDFNEFETEFRSLAFDVGHQHAPIDIFRFAIIFRIPGQRIESARHIFVAARAALAKRVGR